MANIRIHSFIIMLLFVFLSTYSDFFVAATEKEVYIVYMGGVRKNVNAINTKSVHLGMLEKVLDTSSARESLVYSYGKSFNGFAAKITEQEQQKLKGMKGVVSVFKSETLQLHTTRSWDFLGFPTTVNRMPDIESDVIIGVIDTGIWPESKSFSDNGFGAPPSKWKGTCQKAQNFTCNNKIIGARFYYSGEMNSTQEMSARDFEGHGSHTASTAAGNEVKHTSLYGIAEGTVRGAVPSARIAVYKACWSEGCFAHDIMAAFDDAIADGVDILSVSLGGPNVHLYMVDPIAIGSFHAMKRGILTSASAGNNGPSKFSIPNMAPWMLTVAASSTDRRIISSVTTGNNITFMGHAVNTFPTQRKYLPIINGRECLNGSLGTDLVKGKIVYCETFGQGVVQVPFHARASGMVISDDTGKDDTAFTYPLPATALTVSQGTQFKEYLNSTRKPVAKIYRSQTIHDPNAPNVVSFSSRGGFTSFTGVLKPDISAPGVDILAAWSPKALVSNVEGDRRSVRYNIISGTSMSCPHATGAAAYVKSFHPSWSPAAIKSALMTTASPMNASYNREAEVAYGAGQIDPLKAINAGLVYDLQMSDYIKEMCYLGYHADDIEEVVGENVTCPKVIPEGRVTFLNYPTMGGRVLARSPFSLHFPRTVTNVGRPNSTYELTIGVQPKLNVTVNPKVLSFKSLNEKQQFSVNVSGQTINNDEVLSTWILWSDGIYNVRSPIVISSS